MSRKSASSWVDRGESPIPKLQQSLAHFFERFDEEAAPFLDEHAKIVFGMVSADASEVQVAMYLRGVVRDVGFPAREPLGSRLFAISMWHIAKSALVRDEANRVLHRELSASGKTSSTLGDWLAERFMTPAELREYQQRACELFETEHLSNEIRDKQTDGAYAD
ncbi:MAG: hypothetical protein ABJB74_20855 [Gemmatimonas sp.]